MSLISLNNLSFSYRTASGDVVPVLKNLNLDIEAGELIAIQGPSGSGKSTLLYIIGCLLGTYSGQLRIVGQDISKLNDEQLAVLRNQLIGFVFQQFHLLPKATVVENILLPSRYPSEFPANRDANALATKLIEELGLKGRTQYYPNQLSGGQQQRVSIARALLNNTKIILADEPTGSLDTINSQQIMELLKSANQSGRTVVIITHDPDIAQQCERVVHIRDGEIKKIVVNNKSKSFIGSEKFLSEFPTFKEEEEKSRFADLGRYFQIGKTLFPLALQNLQQNRSRSLLTMLGIVIGIAAVFSMITIGSFTKRKILDTYAEMGVNTIVFYGYPNWDLKATDHVSTIFQSFDWGRDIEPIKKVFSEVIRISPSLHSWDNRVSYGGKSIESDVRSFGISSDGLSISNRKIILGNNLSPYHVENRSAVCVIGYDIFQRLFSNVSPIGQIISVSQRESSFGCRVIGVLSSQTSNKEWNKPNLQVYLPYTFFQGTSDPWNSRIREVLIQVQKGADVEMVGKKIKAFFEKKFGKSGRFGIGSDSVLISQMNRFLSLFTILLGAIALVSLGVGGIGITNMMLVSVSERYKEIGIRKAFGATNLSIRTQYLIESIFICSIAGTIGLVFGFFLYQGAIFGATQLVTQLEFEWTVDITALLLSVVSILGVGVLSGLTPAWKAEKLQVIEALRSE